jgi:hypothetical protein
MLKYCLACRVYSWLCHTAQLSVICVCVCVCERERAISEKLVRLGTAFVSGICKHCQYAHLCVVLKIEVLLSDYGLKQCFDLYLLKAVQVCTMCQTSL